MDELQGGSLYFTKHGALVEIGRVLTWLGENCETFSYVLTMERPVARPDDGLSIRVAFRDSFEAAAFSARFMDRQGQKLAP